MIDLSSNEPIRTLGMYQPFATLMMHGKIETRAVLKDRKPPFPLGPYLIYATQKECSENDLAVYTGFDLKLIDRINRTIENDETRALRGHALCLGWLMEVRDMTPADEEMSFIKYMDMLSNDYFKVRRVVLIFRDMHPIKPFEFKGHQGIGFLKAVDRPKIQFV